MRTTFIRRLFRPLSFSFLLYKKGIMSAWKRTCHVDVDALNIPVLISTRPDGL